MRRICLMKLKVTDGRPKKWNNSNNHRHRGYRLDYISSDHWRNFYCNICQRCWPTCWRCLRWVQCTFSLLTVATRKYFKTLTVNQEKHNAIKLFAQSKLDNMANIVAQVMQDENISPTEFHRVLQEVEKYRKLKANIENLAEAKIKQINTP